MCSVDSGLWCWDATTQAASDDAPSQRRGWRGVLSFSFEAGMRQGRVTLPCKSLRGVRAPNIAQLRPPETWVFNVQQSGLSAIAAYYLWRGLAPSTRWNYNTPRARFTTFCEHSDYRHYNGGCLPAKASWLIEWLCSLAGTIKVKTMKLYLTGIKSYQLDLGIDCKAFADPRLERIIQGIKRDHNEPERRTRTRLTRPYLLRVLASLSPDHYDDIVIRAAFTLAFAGFLRVGEFTYKEADWEMGPSFQKWLPTKSSIRISQDGQYMDFTLPSSKTDPFRKGIKLTIAASNDRGCPVLAMQQFYSVDTHRPHYAPLFCIGRNKRNAFTREYVVQRLQQLARGAGLEREGWNGHSFRRGAATWAAEAGIAETEIQTLGRWRSDAYKAYIEYSRDERIALSKRFQGSLSQAI